MFFGAISGLTLKTLLFIVPHITWIKLIMLINIQIYNYLKQMCKKFIFTES